MGSPLDMAQLGALIDEHLDDACELAEQRGGSLWPRRRVALARLSACGDPQEGFVWYRCDGCGVDRVVGTSCKTRLLCPLCGGRKMASTAVHLVERVLPDQKLRQWVSTFPQPLPRLLAWRPEVLGTLLSDLAVVVEADLRRRTGEPRGRAGMVSSIQNFTGDLRLFVHIHSLVPDGVFVESGGVVRFVQAPTPTAADIQRVAAELAARVYRSTERWRRRLEATQGDLANQLLEQLARLGQEMVGLGPRPKAERPDARQRRWIGRHEGVEVHLGVTVRRGDAHGRERLARYISRPALCLKRIEREEDGRILIRFKQPWRNGTLGIRLNPAVFLLRIATLMPPPRVNLTRYHGVFAAASPIRSRVIPKPPKAPVSRPAGGWILWRHLTFHSFGRRPDHCPFCGEKMTRMGTLQGRGRAAHLLRWIEAFGDWIHNEPDRPP
jgi:hypothetical protein